MMSDIDKEADDFVEELIEIIDETGAAGLKKEPGQRIGIDSKNNGAGLGRITKGA